MKVQVLHVPGCPGAEVLSEHLVRLSATWPGLRIDRRVVRDDQEAIAAGMTGSPTLLIDGTDPFAEPAREPGIACRLYRHSDGSVDNAPSLAALRHVLAARREQEGASR
ncbi:hypothetical protein [Amycolatopsis sp. CA-230715]|uniref:hypothetical protein n=1 Tax=Amycolatopsis sp. CA-230715 TaxID=2745196 RepID=UPI001C0131A6|nr:hypothetical protein [Amycolatopsis sp. CA-230715]QWF76801.1 hypothetical protein HUW46_00180 [Amycolatopsis sp. CA-230715]